jgi:hypothetical protein
MNAAAGNNPEGAAITKVTRSHGQQSAQSRPVGVGKGDLRRKFGLAGAIENLAGNKSD